MLVKALTYAALILATSAAFGGVLSNGWIFLDDPIYATKNPYVTGGLTWEGFVWFLHTIHGGNWHPLTSWSHMLDAELFGDRPRGAHAVNLGLHIVNGCLLLRVLDLYTRAWWRSAAVAMLFALHPLRVESVAWAAERKDVLSTLFLLLSLAAYQRWVSVRSWQRYALLVLAFVAGLLSKPMLVTLPFVLLLLDVWPLGRLSFAVGAPWKTTARSLVREKLPLFGLSAAAALVTFFVQRATGATPTLEHIPMLARASNACLSYVRYVGKSVYPAGLAVYYPYDRNVHPSSAVLAALALVAVTALVLWQRRPRPYLAVGWLWYVGTLVPVIGLVQVGGQAYADRYTYVPGIGLAIAVVWFVHELCARRASVLRLAALSCVGVAAWLAVRTHEQVALWRDSRTLFAHALAVTRDNAMAHQVYGYALLSDNEIDPAIEHLNEALRLVPSYPDALKNLGVALGVKGRYDEAIVHFREALKMQPSVEVHHDLGFVLSESKRFDEAILEFQAALVLDPDHAKANSKLGIALGALGRIDEALPYLQRAVKISPSEIEPRRHLAITLTLKGDVEAAIVQYKQLLEHRPEDLDALNNIAWIRATHADAAHRNGDEAVVLAERARDSSPEPVAVLFSTLGAAYGEVGRFEDAARAAERAIELARAADETADAKRFAAQLESYRANKPFHLP